MPEFSPTDACLAIDRSIEIGQLRARIEQLQLTCKLQYEVVERLSAENAGLREENARLSSVDSDNAGLEYAADNDANELARLRERVAELEKSDAELRDDYRLLYADLEETRAWHSAGVQIIREKEQRERLLLEAVQWLHSELKDCESCRTHEPAHIPEKFAPLIAEAAKPVRVAHPPCRHLSEVTGVRCTLERHHDGDHEHE